MRLPAPAIIALLLISSSTTHAADTPHSRPNILLITLDDVGYGDIACFGGKDAVTPNIDDLAKSGVRCTAGYVTAPRCSPSRAALMTGRYQQRFGHEDNPGRRTRNEIQGLPLTERTIADILKHNGYATALVGKWHLGFHPIFHPQHRGFDEFFGFLTSAYPYDVPDRDRRNVFLRGQQRIEPSKYITEELTDEALAFIDRNQARPFFLHLSYNAAHTPYHVVPEKYSSRVKHITLEPQRTIAGMILAADDGIGRVKSKLRELGLERNTLIVFLTDNGSALPEGVTGTGPLRGGKGRLYEGGIRIPFIISWPAAIPAGKDVSHMVSAIDVLPTALAAARISPAKDQRPLDGVDLLPTLTGASTAQPHEYLFWRYPPGSVVRKGKWKLLRLDKEPPALYDLDADLSESRNVIAHHPDIVKDLESAYANWSKDLVAPLW